MTWLTEVGLSSKNFGHFWRIFNFCFVCNIKSRFRIEFGFAILCIKMNDLWLCLVKCEFGVIIFIFWAMFDSFQCKFIVFCVRVLFVKIIFYLNPILFGIKCVRIFELNRFCIVWMTLFVALFLMDTKYGILNWVWGIWYLNCLCFGNFVCFGFKCFLLLEFWNCGFGFDSLFSFHCQWV